MKKLTLLIISLTAGFAMKAQVTQIGVGAPSTVEYFSDNKYDAVDGTTIHVGAVGSTGVGNGTDCYIVKLDAARQIVWQKTISNAGDDYFTRVSKCSNGDYLAVGKLTRSGKMRGFVCRISSAGVLLWSTTSQNTATANGDYFNDVVELTGGNIAAVGVSNFGSGTSNALVVVLNSSGTQQWGRTLSYASTDEFNSVAQLPSGNLILNGMAYISSRYKTLIIEMNPSTAAIISQNEYNIATSVSGVNTNINTLWPISNVVVGSTYYFAAITCTGFAPDVNNPVTINAYNPTTKAVTCQLYYNTGLPTASTFYTSVIAANDYFVSLCYSGTQAFVSRVTSGAVAYSRKIDNTNVGIIYGTAINGSNLYLSGKTVSNEAYAGFSTTSFPLSTAPSCSIITSNTLQVTNPSITGAANTMTFTTSNAIMLSPGVSFSNYSATVSNICGLIPCIPKVLLQSY